MSTTLKIASLPNRASPAGARAAAGLFTFANLALAKLFDKPTPGRMTLAQEAEEVRAMADRVRKSDPGFAADLYAAAARHECLGD